MTNLGRKNCERENGGDYVQFPLMPAKAGIQFLALGPRFPPSLRFGGLSSKPAEASCVGGSRGRAEQQKALDQERTSEKCNTMPHTEDRKSVV